MRMDRSKRYDTISFTVTRDEKKKISLAAFHRGVSMASYVRSAALWMTDPDNRALADWADSEDSPEFEVFNELVVAGE